MADTIQCATHGERQQAFVCTHLSISAVGLGFNRNLPTTENPYPDAWCGDCELIRAAHGGWNEKTKGLVKIALLCSGCYERARIRNTRTSVTLENLASLRWKCGSCEEWHTGPCLDFGCDSPDCWCEEHQKNSRVTGFFPKWSTNQPKTFLNEDYCAIDDENFFVRGLIQIPIIGTAKNFCWGVWGSLSRENFATLLKNDSDPKRADLPPMFSWLSSQLPEYPDMLGLKMYAHIQKPNGRPIFELEPTCHPLAQEFYTGITAERVKDLMLGRLPDNR